MDFKQKYQLHNMNRYIKEASSNYKIVLISAGVGLIESKARIVYDIDIMQGIATGAFEIIEKSKEKPAIDNVG